MHFIAVDPGETTGIAVFHNSRCIATFTDGPGDDVLSYALWKWADADLVVERGPRNRSLNSAACSKVEHKLASTKRRITWILPAEWKPSPMATLARAPWVTPTTRHERDAVKMGNYYIGRADNR